MSGLVSSPGRAVLAALLTACESGGPVRGSGMTTAVGLPFT